MEKVRIKYFLKNIPLASKKYLAVVDVLTPFFFGGGAGALVIATAQPDSGMREIRLLVDFY